MTFLQPFILWGLPLILLPVIIHLLNRMRHRPQPWAAMQFLVAATRSSVNNARLRQWLILLMRVLAVAMLILFLSRPLAGGWLGWALSPAPDAILILLDRSASMEATVPGSTISRREQALGALAQAAKEFEETSHLVLIDSASRQPQEVAQASSLIALRATAPSDTAADIPGLLASAVNWLIQNRAGTAELWIASDLQQTNWHPDDPRWESLVAQLHALPQKVRIRLLALDQEGELNRSVALKEFVRQSRGADSQIQFAIDIQASSPAKETIPVTLNLDGTRIQKDLSLEGQAYRWRNKAALPNNTGNGWGSFELPADGNRLDNVTYFVYGPEPALRATIIGAASESAKLLQLAIAAAGKPDAPLPAIVQPSDLDRAIWEDSTLLIWTGPVPSGATGQRLRAFVQEGGTVLFLPSEQPDTTRFEGVGWGDVQAANENHSFRVLRWTEDEGPLAKSDEGLSLPLSDAAFQKRQLIAGQTAILAAFDDGIPFLTRQTLGQGEIYFCASRPELEWSSLGDGPVLVPMIQRLLQSGSRRLQQVLIVNCGELSAVDQARRWDTVDGVNPKDIRVQAGVYRSGERLLAVNRPKVEDDLEVLDANAARQLFGPLNLQMLQESRSQAGNLQGEVWRLFVFCMLLFLVMEGLLMLPSRSKEEGSGGGLPGVRPIVPEAGVRV